jgi:hypothetical protein
MNDKELAVRNIISIAFQIAKTYRRQKGVWALPNYFTSPMHLISILARNINIAVHVVI